MRGSISHLHLLNMLTWLCLSKDHEIPQLVKTSAIILNILLLIEGLYHYSEDLMVGWHHWLNGHEFEQALGVGDGLGSLAFCRPWGRKELETTEWVNWTDHYSSCIIYINYPLPNDARMAIFTFCNVFHLCLSSCWVASVVFESLWSHGPWPTRFLYLWYFSHRYWSRILQQDTGVGCHVLL